MQRAVVDNRYSIVRELGSGGMANVYLAHDEVLDRDVALKVLRGQYSGDEEFAERFKREALSAASLSHPHIVPVYDRGEDELDGTSYIAMEYVPGGTLKERLVRSAPLPAAVATAVAAQIAEALEAAHRKGVIHRDIKPQNVLVTASGDLKVTDFGIARAASSSTVSHTGTVLGTAGYLSPEQATGRPVTPRSDLYSLGVVLYEMLTGELPFTADNPIAVSIKHAHETPRPPRELNPNIPENLNSLVIRLLSKNPEDRPASAADLADELWRMGHGSPSAAAVTIAAPAAAPKTAATRAAQQTVRTVPPARGTGRSKTPWLLVPLLGLLLLIGGGWALSQNLRDFSLGDVFGGAGQAGTVEIPPVKGLTREEASRELEAAGLRAGFESRASSAEAAGTVLGQSPAAGQRIEEGSRVVLAIGDGSASANDDPASQASPSSTASPSAASSADASAGAPDGAPASADASASAPAQDSSAQSGQQEQPVQQGQPVQQQEPQQQTVQPARPGEQQQPPGLQRQPPGLRQEPSPASPAAGGEEDEASEGGGED